MKVLITGGAGFIGSTIARFGASKDHEITVVDNLSTGYEENLQGLNIHLIKGDILDRELLIRISKGMDAVFHLAASVGNVKSLENPIQDHEVNYGGTLNVLEAVRRNSVPQLIYSSTAAGYGEPVRLPIDEDHPFNPDSPYGVTKIAAEKLALCYGRTYGFQVVCLRYFNAYGINQRYDAYGNVIPIFVKRHLARMPLTVYGDGLQTRDFINVNDIATANWQALETKIRGYYNVATGIQTSIKSLIEVIGTVSGIEPQVNYVSPRKGEVKHSVADITKVKNVLNYEPTVQLLEGMRDYWNWYRSIEING
jgi:UDP-glucose 4-epimerase